MKKKLKIFTTRSKIVFSTIAITVIFFALITPIVGWIGNVLTSPEPPINIVLSQFNNNIALDWENPDVIDHTKTFINTGTEVVELEREVTSYSIDAETYPINLEIYTKDIFGLESEKITKTIEEPSINNFRVEERLNQVDVSGGIDSQNVFIRSIILAVVILAFTWMIFDFKIQNIKVLVLLFYPAVVILPFILLTSSFVIGENEQISKLGLTILFSIGMYIITYFVLLTVNILNVSLTVTIPLEQAAKASQFIFSLISSYIVLILFFGSNYNFIEKIAFILPFIYFLTYAAIQMLKNISLKQTMSRTVSITSTIFFAIFVFSIWPIDYVYTILAVAVCYYILLSIALEVRTRLNKYVWVEYLVLIGLVSVLLLVNASWGINGTLV